MLVVSLEAFEHYQRNEAWTWEHMALCRARAVFGSQEVRERTERLIQEILKAPRDARTVVRDAIQMRAEMEQHKPPQSALDVKLGPGGLVDLEFAIHVLQLTSGIGFHPRLEFAIGELHAEGLVTSKIVGAQKLLTRMLVMMRLTAPGDVQPNADTWQLVAEACHAASWDELLAEHDAARQSVADLWNRIKQEG
jgi:glutamate-ammonia-ligase adenylyltransferase